MSAASPQQPGDSDTEIGRGSALDALCLVRQIVKLGFTCTLAPLIGHEISV
jgi:hypothetical protein